MRKRYVCRSGTRPRIPSDVLVAFIASALFLLPMPPLLFADGQDGGRNGDEDLIFQDGFEVPDLSAWSDFFGGRLPSISIIEPRFGLVINEPLPEIEIRLYAGSRPLDLDTLRVEILSQGSPQDITDSCELSDDGFSQQTAICQTPAPLDAGFHDIIASVANTLGFGTTGSETFELLLDTEPPVIEVETPADGSLLTSPSVAIRGRVEDDDQVVRLRAGPRSQDVTLEDGEFNFPFAIDSGENKIELDAWDRAGNKGSVTLVLRLDAAAPQITVETPLPGTTTNRATIEVAGTVSDAAGTGVETLTVNGIFRRQRPDGRRSGFDQHQRRRARQCRRARARRHAFGTRYESPQQPRSHQ